MRWMWIWFLLVMSFPLITPPSWVRASGGKTHATRPAKWGGPLAPVLDRLDWVDGHRTSTADLRGQVVIAEIWTFECVNCRRTLPAMKSLSTRYRGTDVRIVSIHTPELENERDPKQVAKAVAREEIDWPVALDPDGIAWEALGNRYWPCVYLLGRDGKVLYRHIGELHEGTAEWDEMIRRIESLRAPQG